MIIDTHSHLDGEEFADDLPEVIQRAKDGQVEKILVPNVNLQGLPHLIEVCDAYPDNDWFASRRREGRLSNAARSDVYLFEGKSQPFLCDW